MKKTFIISCFLMAAQGFAQQNYWSKIKDNTSVSRENLAPRWTAPNRFSLYQLDIEKLKADLKKAPQRLSGDESLVVKFPGADGNIRSYIVQEASVMEPGLQSQFPEIRSYTG